jgi:hypothetical protein
LGGRTDLVSADRNAQTVLDTRSQVVPASSTPTIRGGSTTMRRITLLAGTGEDFDSFGGNSFNAG